jgi:hypothetical protein
MPAASARMTLIRSSTKCFLPPNGGSYRGILSACERFKIKGFANFFNLFNRENLSFGDRLGTSSAQSSLFLQPVSLYGPGFGPPVGIPFTFQLGARVDF